MYQDSSSINTASRPTQTGERDADAISRLIIWRILRQKSVRSDNATNIPKTNLPRRTDGSAVVPPKIHVEPADDYGQGAVGTHRDEEEGAVFEVRAVVSCDEDGETGDCDSDGDEGEEEAVFGQVGEESDHQGEDEGGGPGRDGVELGADLAVAVGLYDAWREEGVAFV